MVVGLDVVSTIGYLWLVQGNYIAPIRCSFIDQMDMVISLIKVDGCKFLLYEKHNYNLSIE